MKSEAQTNTAGLIAIKCNLQSSSKSCVTVPGTALAVMAVQGQKHLHTLLCCQLWVDLWLVSGLSGSYLSCWKQPLAFTADTN